MKNIGGIGDGFSAGIGGGIHNLQKLEEERSAKAAAATMAQEYGVAAQQKYSSRIARALERIANALERL